MSTDVRVCKVDGCEEPAAALRGTFALLCETHAAEKRTARAASSNGAAVPVRADQLHEFGFEVGTLVLDFEARVEAAIDQACADFATLLRRRLEAGEL